MNTVGVQDKGWIRNIVFAGGLAQREPLLQHAENRLGHGLGSPGLEWTTFAEPQLVHHVVVRVPALLPHGLQLVLVAVWNLGCEKDKDVIT